ncbi:hypothetical protein C0995_009267 [Termitomyces sp. Mi166|nr:hypothetical protein C0995_009267 [Termitomyces sp. Mi166\
MSHSRSPLPTELVHKIILSCLLDPAFYTNPFDLARVSRQWRRVVDSENSLWETLHITWIQGPNVHHYLLHPVMRVAPFGARAQDLGTTRNFLERAQDWLTRSRDADAKLSLSLETDGTEPQALLPTLFTRYRNRLRRLSLTASMTTIVRLLRCIQKLRLSGELLLPHLEEFEIHIAYRAGPGSSLRGLRQLDLSRWMALKHLKLRGARPNHGDRDGLLNYQVIREIPFMRLTSLYLEDHPCTFADAREVLDRCGHLEEFSVLVSHDDENSEVLPFHETTLSNLRIIQLYFVPISNACGFIAHFFSELYTPALKDLTVDAPYAIDESSKITTALSHMLQPSRNSHPIQVLTLSIDLDVESVISMLRNLANLKYLRLCAPVRTANGTYLKCGYLRLLEIMTQAHKTQDDIPLLEEIYIEDNVPSEICRMTSLLSDDGKLNPDIAYHLGVFVIQSLVESRCTSKVHIRCVSLTWKNAGQDWPSVELDTGEYNCPYNQPQAKVGANLVEIVVKCSPHCQREI